MEAELITQDDGFSILPQSGLVITMQWMDGHGKETETHLTFMITPEDLSVFFYCSLFALGKNICLPLIRKFHIAF